jgi:hypothetical protein
VTDPSGRISRFSRQEPLLFYQVAPQLYSWGWVDPVPDPLHFFFLVVPQEWKKQFAMLYNTLTNTKLITNIYRHLEIMEYSFNKYPFMEPKFSSLSLRTCHLNPILRGFNNGYCLKNYAYFYDFLSLIFTLISTANFLFESTHRIVSQWSKRICFGFDLTPSN